MLMEACKQEWAECTVHDACKILASPDVAVTNQKDKDVLLPKINAFSEEMRQHASEIERRRKQAEQATATTSTWLV